MKRSSSSRKASVFKGSERNSNAIIATSTSGIPEAITHEVEGLLVAAGDPAAIAVPLYRLLSDPALNLQGQRSPLAYVFGERSNAGSWQKRSLTLDVTSYRGQRLWIYGSVANDGQGGRAWMALDDIEVAFCP